MVHVVMSMTDHTGRVRAEALDYIQYSNQAKALAAAIRYYDDGCWDGNARLSEILCELPSEV